jgi:hypothetical protein
MAPSMAVNATHQLAHTHGALAWPLATASILSVLLTSAAPFAMKRAKADGDVGLRLVAASVFIVCGAYNLSSAIGAASTSRSEGTGARAADNAKHDLLAGQLADAEKRRAALALTAGERTAAMIDADLQAMRQDKRWSRSKDCAEATKDDSREFCAQYAGKLAVHDAAAKVESLDRDITAIKGQLLAGTGASAGQPADPQAANIATAFAVIGVRSEASDIGVGLNLLFAVVVEVIGSLGPVVLASIFFSEKSGTGETVQFRVPDEKTETFALGGNFRNEFAEIPKIGGPSGSDSGNLPEKQIIDGTQEGSLPAENSGQISEGGKTVRFVPRVVPQDAFVQKVLDYRRAGVPVTEIAKKMKCGKTKVYAAIKPKAVEDTTKSRA